MPALEFSAPVPALEFDREATSYTHSAGEQHLPAVEFDNTFHQGKPQASACILTIQRAIDLDKGLKQFVDMFWGNTNTCIDDGNLQSFFDQKMG